MVDKSGEVSPVFCSLRWMPIRSYGITVPSAALKADLACELFTLATESALVSEDGEDTMPLSGSVA